MALEDEVWRITSRATLIIAAATTLAALSACAATPEASPGIAAAQPSIMMGQTSYSQDPIAGYLLQPADVISVLVFREEALSLPSVPISASGQISIPLIGEVKAAGLSSSELETELERALNSRFLRNPDVTINIIEYASHQVTVEGAVRTPGIYRFSPGTKLSGGIALAEGTTRTAKLRSVAIFRKTDRGVEIAKFDYAAVSAGTMLDPLLMPGDRIVVGTDGLSVFWKDVLTALPAFALFTVI